MTYMKRVDRGGDEPVRKGNYISWLGPLGADPFAALDSLGPQPMFWAEEPGDVDGHWVATRFEDVRDILQDAETFSSVDSNVPYIQMDDPLLPTETDPPYTQKLRTLLMPLLTAKKVGALEPRMRDVCASIIEGFKADGHCDAVEQFSRIYPITIFIEFFGLAPERKEEFRRQANIFLHDAALRADAWAQIRAIVREQLISKRENPQDDLLSAIANGKLDGQQVDLTTAVSVASTVFLGGLDTLPSNISWSLRLLAGRPDLRRKLIEEPGVIPAAVEEFLRLYSVANPVRRVVRSMDFKGTNLVAGDRILCSIAAANRDPTAFGKDVDFERLVNPHLAFATGPHRCLGSHLARHELGVALEIWHSLIPDYRVPEGAVVEFSGPVFAIETLPLEWDV
jgi:cytochrome P450